MQLNNLLKSKLYVMSTFGLLISLTSCGSFQYAGQETDGIYDDSDERVVYLETTEENEYDDKNSSAYYKNYFKEKADLYDDVSEEEDIIFTDIDSYEGSYTDENIGEDTEYNSYAGWGGNSSSVTINVINNGWNNWGYGFYDPFWNYRWGWNTWGWNRWNYGWGYNNWGWNRWNYGWGYNNWGLNYWSGWNFGWGYDPLFSGYYNRRTVAYNASRRSNTLRGINSTTSRRSSLNTTSRSRNESSRVRNINTRTRDNINRPNRTSRNNSNTRPTRTIRNQNSAVKPARTKSNTRKPSTTTRTRTNSRPSYSRPSSSSNRSYSSPSRSSSRSSGVSSRSSRRN